MRILELLLYIDEPVLFIAEWNKLKILVNLIDAEEGWDSYVAATPTDQMLKDLKENKIDIFDAFQKGPFYEIQWDWSKQFTTVEEVTNLDPKDLVTPGIFLTCN